MSYGIDLGEGTFKNLVEYTDKVYKLHTSYTVSVTQEYSGYDLDRSSGFRKPRFFRVTLPTPDSLVSVTTVSGFGENTQYDSAQVIGKVWRGNDSEVYMTTDSRPILVGVYTPTSSSVTSQPSYGFKISKGSSNITSGDELLFPFAVSPPNLLKDKIYKDPVSVCISTVGSRLSNALNRTSFYGEITYAETPHIWFTAVYWKDSKTPVGTTLVLAYSNSRVYGQSNEIGAVVMTEHKRATSTLADWGTGGSVKFEDKLSMGAIMVVKKPGVSKT